ncbi:hypothetical protein [Streptomyces sp. NPDC086989]|uniref:hypothetical protein n=1 Tax=Streptomyces sp. NPDC086989 TaxID=3365764 RepID=UPI0037FF4C13
MRASRAAAAVLLSAVVLAGCGSGGGGTSAGPAAGTSSGGGTTASGPAQPSPGPSSGATGAQPAPGKPSGPPAGSSAPGSPVSPGPSSAGERLLTVTRSGGIAGRTSTLLIKGDGSWTRLDGQARPAGSGKLPPERLARLRTALGQADFAHLPKVPKGGATVFDGFRYAFVHEGHEVAAGQESLTPALRSALDELPPFEAE